MTQRSEPTDFATSIAAYEAWMRDRLGTLLVERDLRAKHKLMRQDAFLFLRGTCWRWAEIAAFECAALARGPQVASVGDAHAGNFGLWRDAEGRLVWGVNDYDEAAIIPYRMDVTRLVTSATIARDEDEADADLAAAALDGYAAGIADPRPFVLEQDHAWLRDLFTASDAKRAGFWTRLRKAKRARHPPADYRAALERAMPGGLDAPRLSRRRAGVGSLGRPRIVALVDDAGGPIAREAKAMLPSCWQRDAAVGAQFALSTGRYRCPDPFLHHEDGIVVRRLAPNSRKIDLKSTKRAINRRLIAAMARDLGAVHAADHAAGAAIAAHLKSDGHAWLALAATTMAAATRRDWMAYRTAPEGDA